MGPDQLPLGLISWAASWGQGSSVPTRSWRKAITQHLVQVRRGSAIPLTLSYPEGRGTGSPVRGSRRGHTVWELPPLSLGSDSPPMSSPPSFNLQPLSPLSSASWQQQPGHRAAHTQVHAWLCACKLEHPKQASAPFRASAFASVKWAS